MRLTTGRPYSPGIPRDVLAAARSDGAVIDRPAKGPWLQIGHPMAFEWNRATLPVDGLSPALDGFRILHVTDVHLRRKWHASHDELVRRVRESSPDLLLVTGDFVDDKRDHTPALPNLYRMLESFRGRLGCFGILGNHDTLALGPRLGGTSVRLLSGEREVVRVADDAHVELIGLPGAKRKHLPPDFAASMPPLEANPPGTVRVVLSHFPDHLKRTWPLQPDLFLTGHTHGGQCCLPGMIPIIKHDSLPRRLCSGVHRVGRTWLVVGRGFGTTTLPLRVFCPPEVIEVVLKRGD